MRYLRESQPYLMNYNKPKKMDIASETLFKQLEEQRTLLLKELEKKENVLLKQRPQGGGWNILEVLGHLLQTEKLALSYVNKKMNVISDIPYSGTKAIINKFKLTLIFSMPFRYKAPQIAMPEKSTSLEEFEKEWSDVRKELLCLLDKTGKESRKLLYRHPFAGRMNLLQMMQFFSSHIKHHIKQVDRIQKGIKH
ncbi:MAG TPA: DinB family protein [Bacteroidetes bacterium]|nr:DinB family protein [Bacteroidota bacterium]